MTASRNFGFTMIEVVIAVALTALIVTAVYSATTSMSAVAQRQRDVRSQQVRLSRFSEILKRDVHGWVANKDSLGVAERPGSADQLLLEFTTSSDALGGSVAKEGAFDPARAVQVRYVARKKMNGFEIVRSEKEFGGTSTEFVLLQTNEAPTIEFCDAGKWSEKCANRSLRPAALRLTLDQGALVLRP